MRFKLGLFLKDSKEIDIKLIDGLFALLDEFGFDMTTFLRNITNIKLDENLKENEGISDNDLDFVEVICKFSMNFEFLEEKNKPKLDTKIMLKLYEIFKCKLFYQKSKSEPTLFVWYQSRISRK